MTYSPLVNRTSWDGGKSDPRDGVGISSFIIHCAAMTSLDGYLGLVTGDKEVSSNYSVKDNTVVSIVPDERRAFTSASKYDGDKGRAWDYKSLTVEIINATTNPYTVSEQSLHSAAKLVAERATHYGFPINPDTVIGHRELYSRFGASYSTECPAGIDMDQFRALVTNYYTAAKSASIEEDPMRLMRTPENGAIFFVTSNGFRYMANSGEVSRVQAALGAAGLDPEIHTVPYALFIDLMTNIHAADTANDSDFGAVRQSVESAVKKAAAI